MQVRELTALETLQSLQLLTGDYGLDTEMKDVVLLEYESLKQEQPNYYCGDFIISTLYYAKDHPELLYTTIERLINLGAAGLAFKSVYYTQLPDAVIHLAQEHNFPIFMFDGLYIEDVILTIADYMRLRQEFSRYEEPLFKILQGSAEGYGIEQLCARMNPNRQKYMNAVYIHSPDMASDWSSGLRSTLQLRSSQKLADNYRFLQFRRGFFVLSNHTELTPLEEVGRDVIRLLSALGCDTDTLCFGVGNFHQRSIDFDCVIREAFDALLVAILDRTQLKLYPELRLYQAVFPMVRDKSTRETMRQLFEKLDAYDHDTNSGCLLGTLKAHAQNNYDIRQTAEFLGQHPNTIRYRLKKICELTASPRESAHALFLMGEFLKIDSLSSAIF